MRRGRTPLIIPSEVQAREFDGKLLLACFAAERGLTSIVGCRNDIHLGIASLPRSIYLAKDVRSSSDRMFDILERLGHAIVALDEEAPFYYSRQFYLNARVSPPAFRRTRALFAWGPENAEAWQGCPCYHGAPIHVTGNPRADMMRPELRPFYAEEARRVRERFGSFVLVNSNFASLNHYLPGQSTLRPPGSATAPNAHAAHRQALFRHFLEIVPQIAAAFPEHNVVVRPHPVENHETWRAAAGGLANVHVVHEGSVIPWLLAARVMIHNGCTTGLEGYLLDAPIVAYRPVSSDDFDQRLPNSLSHEVFDTKALLDAVATALAGGLVWDAEAARVRRELAAHHLAALDGPLASQRIADVLDRFEATAGRTTPPILTRIVGRVRAARRRRSKLRHAGTPGHKRNLAYTRHRFPGIALPEVQERIGRLGVLLGRFERVQARGLGDNVFEVTSV